MKKYPVEFEQPESFSFIRFYNTYQTISLSEVMINNGRISSQFCNYIVFNDESERARLAPLIRGEYSKNSYIKHQDIKVQDIFQFKPITPNCLTKSKLINFEFKCNEAYATFACESGEYVSEFTYTSNGGRKCGVINYKKSWGVEPKRTLNYTRDIVWLDVTPTMFDSPSCEPR